MSRLHVIDVRGGQGALIACGSWTVSGSDDPATWRYHLHFERAVLYENGHAGRR